MAHTQNYRFIWVGEYGAEITPERDCPRITALNGSPLEVASHWLVALIIGRSKPGTTERKYAEKLYAACTSVPFSLRLELYQTRVEPNVGMINQFH